MDKVWGLQLRLLNRKRIIKIGTPSKKLWGKPRKRKKKKTYSWIKNPFFFWNWLKNIFRSMFNNNIFRLFAYMRYMYVVEFWATYYVSTDYIRISIEPRLSGMAWRLIFYQEKKLWPWQYTLFPSQSYVCTKLVWQRTLLFTTESFRNHGCCKVFETAIKSD